MPYLTENKKKRLAPVLEALRSVGGVEEVGEINYLACMIVLEYMKIRPINYRELSAAIAAVGDAREELRDQLLRVLENYKAVANGDIFEDLCERIKFVMSDDVK